MNLIRWILVALVAWLWVSNVGCTPGDRMAYAFANGAAAAGGTIAKQLALDSGQISVSGQGIQPGMEVVYRVETSVGTRIAGVAGQFNMSGVGQGGAATSASELAATIEAMSDNDLRQLSRLLAERMTAVP